MTASHTPAHFERLYQSSPDPWDYQTSAYEAEKYRHALAALGDARFNNALEVGCSIGVLTARLAARCNALLGLDVIEQALNAARQRNAAHQWVRFERIQVPASWPAGRFDLIVLSEVLYYFVPADISRIAARVIDSLDPGGTLLLVNWLSHGDDPLSGDDAAAHFLAAVTDRLTVVHQDRRAANPTTEHHSPGYRLDLLKAPG